MKTGSRTHLNKQNTQNTQKKLKGRDIIIKCLENEGVEVIFGYPGGASMELHQALTSSKKIRMVLPRHEQGGSFAACGYARATGKPGVCMATSGPGATNLMTGIMDAKMDSIPLIAITGQVPTTVIGNDAFQETDILGATFPCIKHSYLVKDIESIPAIIHEAFKIAVEGRPGPVLIDFPKDIQQQEASPDFAARITRMASKKTPKLSLALVKKAATLINEAKRPVIYAGGGIISSNSSSILRQVAHTAQIPVTTTLMGLGVFPEDDPLSLTMLGMHGAVYANVAMNKADVILAVGIRFDDRVTGKISEFCKDARFIHVDIDASEINKNIKATLPIQADAQEFLDALLPLLNKNVRTEWLAQVQGWKKEFAHHYELSSTVITPQHVVKELCRLAPKDAIISVGVGQHQMWAAQFYTFTEPRTWICSSGAGAMGFGLPAAMGAQIAFPNRTVIDIDGDGSFLMNIQELQTLRQEKIPVKSLILNNMHLGMVAQWEDRFYESVRGHTFLGEADFAGIAKAFGIEGETIRHPDEVVPALQRMLASKGPYVLDVKYPYDDQNRGHVIPMIPGNKTYLDTILWNGQTLGDYWKVADKKL